MKRNVLPGFGITMGITIVYLSLIVLIPLCGLFLRLYGIGIAEFWDVATEERVLSAMKLTFGAAFLAACANGVFGFIVAWVLCRYTFPLRRLIDAMIDLPFALPTAVSGIALTTLFLPHGWLGRFIPFQVAYTQIGIFVAMTFIGLPFVVRTLQPAILDIEKELEEVAASLGATRLQTFFRVILPSLLPSLITGFALAFARALGEYGSVIFISGNRIGQTEIVAKIITVKLDQARVQEAIVIAVVMLLASFVLLFIINVIQGRFARTLSV